MKLIAIAAMAQNRVIGNGLSIPWKHSADMRYFKETTTGHAVVMGRLTYESLGRPTGLPNRQNIVLSRSLNNLPYGLDLIHSPGEINGLVGDDPTFVIGGEEVYKLLLPQCQEALITQIDERHEGDKHMPAFEHLFSHKELIKQEGPLWFWRYFNG